MAASRLFTILGPSIFRNTRNLSQIPPLQFNKVCFPPPLRFNRYSSSALTLDSDASTLTTDDSSDVSAHPWPEWVNFIDRLKAKGYLTQKDAVSGNGGVIDEGAVIYTDMKLVKEACLSFARDRYDIFKSLSPQDIQTVVEKGCPNVFRKTVNSAKRLRAYVELDEGDVCSSCNLRESCDRSYVLLDNIEAVPRTVDIVRILMLYALDPVVISGENRLPGRELIESSARKLLSQLIDLGETPLDPELPKPASVTSPRKKQTNDLLGKGDSKDIEMKPGDWVCTECNFMNFARNIECRKCQAEKPNNSGEMGRKKGDWNCPQCSVLNFASKRQCFRCQEPRPQRDLRPGDWECSQCDFLNFSRNTSCRKCNGDRPLGPVLQTEQHTWKRPY